MDAAAAQVPKKKYFSEKLFGTDPRRTVVRLTLVLAFLYFLLRVVVLIIQVDGFSMYPTYSHGEVIAVSRLRYKFTSPQRGEVVAVWNGSEMLLKRIIALPGEEIGIANGVVFIDDRPLQEPYVKFRAPWNLGKRRLRNDEFFIVGDNRSQRQHEHSFGVVQRSQLLGRAML
jgi:signal peptidase I